MNSSIDLSKISVTNLANVSTVCYFINFINSLVVIHHRQSRNKKFWTCSDYRIESCTDLNYWLYKLLITKVDKFSHDIYVLIEVRQTSSDVELNRVGHSDGAFNQTLWFSNVSFYSGSI